MGSKLKKVVIIGGSFAGRRVHQQLQGKPQLDVVVIEEQCQSEYTPSILRTLVQPSHDIWAPVQQCVTGRAVEIRARGGYQGEVVLSTGHAFPYHYLVLATGSGYIWPIKPCRGVDENKPHGDGSGRKDALLKNTDRLKDASSIVVVGGGPVGVELAGELAGTFKSTKCITLVSSGTRLLARMPEKAGYAASRWLRLAGVEVVCGECVAHWPKGSRDCPMPGTIVLQSGREVTADQVWNCTGAIPNTQLFTCLMKSREIEVDEVECKHGIPVQSTLEVTRCPGVFACGDVAAVSCERTAYTADLMALVVAKNIALLADAASHLLEDVPRKPSLKEFPGGALGIPILERGLQEVPLIACISLYKYNGILQLNSLVMAGPIAALNKCLIEYFQLGTAKGNRALSNTWFTLESISTFLAAVHIVTMHKWNDLKSCFKAYKAI